MSFQLMFLVLRGNFYSDHQSRDMPQTFRNVKLLIFLLIVILLMLSYFSQQLLLDILRKGQT